MLTLSLKMYPEGSLGPRVLVSGFFLVLDLLAATQAVLWSSMDRLKKKYVFRGNEACP